MEERVGWRSVLPHLSWAGPGPSNEMDAYALAILVRLIGTGLTPKKKRTPTIPPSSFKTKDIQIVAMMYAYCKTRIREDNINTYANLLQMIKDSEGINMKNWCIEHEKEVKAAELELIDYVETQETAGFRCYG